MSFWKDILIAVKKGIIPSKEELVNGTTKVGNADKLDGHEAEYFVPVEGYKPKGYRATTEDEANQILNDFHNNAPDGRLYTATISFAVSHSILGGTPRTVIGYRAGDTWGWQIGVAYDTSKKSNIVYRQMAGGDWSAWEKYTTTADLANYFPNTGGDVNGDVTILSNNALARVLKVANSLRLVSFGVKADGTAFMYDNTNAKYIITSATDGTNTFNGTASGNLTNDSKGVLKKYNDTTMGGRLSFEKPTIETDLQANVAVDVYMNQMRFIELGGNVRGAFIDFTKCGASGTSELHHDGNSKQIVVSDTPLSASDTNKIRIY